MVNRILALAALLLAAATTPAFATPNLLVNEYFRNDGGAPWVFEGDAYPTGGNFAVMAGLPGDGGSGAISQTVDTTPGALYNVLGRLAFDDRTSPFSTGIFKVSFGDVVGIDTTFGQLPGGIISSYFFTARATSTRTTLRFEGTGIGFDIFVSDPYVYDPRASLVPEPEAWALMVIGFAALGGGLRAARARRTSAAQSQS